MRWLSIYLISDCEFIIKIFLFISVLHFSIEHSNDYRWIETKTFWRLYLSRKYANLMIIFFSRRIFRWARKCFNHMTHTLHHPMEFYFIFWLVVIHPKKLHTIRREKLRERCLAEERKLTPKKSFIVWPMLAHNVQNAPFGWRCSEKLSNSGQQDLQWFLLAGKSLVTAFQAVISGNIQNISN